MPDLAALRRSASCSGTGSAAPGNFQASGLLGASASSFRSLGCSTAVAKSLALASSTVDGSWRTTGLRAMRPASATPGYSVAAMDSMDALLYMKSRAQQSVVTTKVVRRKGDQLMRINEALDAEMNGIFEKLVRKKALLKIGAIRLRRLWW
eukprot:TRINITY_DN9858_c1_g1_i2.p1 TRINITY_DN9858_c1_g1~~TRINITY_DN9858_c1_g1_i2.p1  ORF type:complete len:151 (+),score=40.53 TRINITY_DN9858_c1_g1_i2:93-545(+)